MTKFACIVALLGLIACGGGTKTSGSGTPSASQTPSASASALATCSPSAEIEVEAEKNQYDKTCLATAGGAAFKIKFKNRDEGTSHNIAITKDQEATQLVFRGATSVGSEDVTYNVPALAKGRYFYHCDFHRGLMEGTLIAT
jgi:plastocyanin